MSNPRFARTAALAFLGAVSLHAAPLGQTDRSSAPFLQPRAFLPIPIRDVSTSGWLYAVLKTQASGLNGALDKFWPQVSQSAWIGYQPSYPTSAGGERPTYWLNGHVRNP